MAKTSFVDVDVESPQATALATLALTPDPSEGINEETRSDNIIVRTSIVDADDESPQATALATLALTPDPSEGINEETRSDNIIVRTSIVDADDESPQATALATLALTPDPSEGINEETRSDNIIVRTSIVDADDESPQATALATLALTPDPSEGINEETRSDNIIVRTSIVDADVESPQATVSTTQTPDPSVAEDEMNEETTSECNENENAGHERKSPCVHADSVGAMQMDEPAPQLNRRFYRGLHRPSVHERINQARASRRGQQQAPTTSASGMDGSTRHSHQGRAQLNQTLQIPTTIRVAACMIRRSSLSATRRFSQYLIHATLVEPEGEVVMAEPVRFSERKLINFAVVTCLFMVVLTVSLSAALGITLSEADVQSDQLSYPPSFDQLPTLEVIRSRGYVKCGMFQRTINEDRGIDRDLCRAIAAVLVGSPDNYEGIAVDTTNRFQTLKERKVDLLARPCTHTVEREVNEKYTGVGFSFSTPYEYGGLIYFGKPDFVACAEQQKRYSECAYLQICTKRSTTWSDLLEKMFPSDYLLQTPSIEDMNDMLLNGTCNVIASMKFFINQKEPLIEGERNGTFVFGKGLLSKEPFAIATRNDDREFSDVVNRIIETILYEEGQKEPMLCQNQSYLTPRDVLDLNWTNSVHCVGNYTEIFGDIGTLNPLNENASGSLYATPFGNLGDGTISIASSKGMLPRIRKNESFSCGVAVPDNFNGNISGSDRLVCMSAEYCRTLAAALHNGDPETTVLVFPEADSNSFIALANKTIDVLVGGRIEPRYNFKQSPSLDGVHFSTPYYYGNESTDEVGIYAIATREDDALFSSFVNTVVLATIYAQENGINSTGMLEMPLVSSFGSDVSWALRDAVAYSGNYDEIYAECFGRNVDRASRGRNRVNEVLAVEQPKACSK